VKVLLVDDHRMVREGLRAVLEKAGVQIVGEAANGRQAVSEGARLRPDIVVMDVGMPELNGIDATRQLLAEVSGVKVVALSMNANRHYVSAMLEAGAAGYVLKNDACEELLDALQLVSRGGTYLSPAIAAAGAEGPFGDRASSITLVERALTAREREVLQLVAEGKSSKEIAAELQIALSTVETHRRQISDKLNLRTIAELTKYAIREGLTSGEV
jgi:DNA-binding NarL/FixJ family response regulator